jgi:predicted transposase YbfD/YdcC
VLGQVKVAEKSNEIVAIPALLDMMAIEGAIVTIDAIGCQRDIAQKILNKTPITCLRSKATKAHCARMSKSSLPSKRPGTSRTQRSA